MLKNYLKIAWRNLTKNKQQTIINLLGLTVGTVSCLTIMLYVFAQLGYDQHHYNAESIYRVKTFFDGSLQGTEDVISATSSPPIAFALKEDFPEIEEAARIVVLDKFFTNLIRASESKDGTYEKRAYMADSTLFKVFTYKFLEGTAETALDQPDDLVMSSSLAKKLFGDSEALGKTVIWGSGEAAMTLKVSGVFDEKFGKSHLNPNYVVSMQIAGIGDFVRGVNNFATQNFAYNYVKLKPNASSMNVNEKLPAFLNSRGDKDLADSGIGKLLTLESITDIHLYSEGERYQIDRVSNINYLYFLLLLAFIIQLVACVNFINLSTARASKRAKEIGVRKVVGAGKNMLIAQFMGESLVLTVFAMLISIPITMLLLPLVNDLTQGSLVYADLLNGKIALLLIGLAIFTGLVAGIYPAIILSSIKPVRVLKNTVKLQSGSENFRKGLVVFQFVVSIILITSVLIITQQFRFTQKKDLGFNKENIIAVKIGSGDALNSYEALMSEFSNAPGVTHVAASRYAPSERVLNDFGLHLPGKNPQNKTLVKSNAISEGYFKTMDISLLRGRDFREGDENQIIVNEATLKAFSIDLEKALGAILLSTYEGETQEFEVIGVVKDYHYASLKETIEPILLLKSNFLGWFLIRSNTENYQSLLENLESRWEDKIPDEPFTYAFVDQEVGKLYEEEKRFGKISAVFTFLAILISCLGLFGLVSFVAEQKKKEIGIRKVLGASINSVVQLLTKDFVKLVGVAFLIATPIAYYFMHRWLEGYTYRIDIQWWVFVLAGGFALGITLLTVGFQSIKSALANPVKSLRTE